MKIVKKILSHQLTILLIYIGIGIIVFWKLFFTFFQQDEWAIFGNYIYWEKAGLSWWDRLFVYEQDTHVAPLSNLFFYPQFKLFGMHFEYYAFCNILVHGINSFLVYTLCKILTKNKWMSILSGLIFLVTSISHQAVTWVGTSVGTTGSVTFLLLSSIYLVKYLKNKNKPIQLLTISSFCWIVSILFKETSVFFILLAPFFWFIYSTDRKFIELLKMFSFFLPLFVLYALFRVILLEWNSSGQLSYGLEQPNIQTLLLRTFFNPIKFVAQSIVPVGWIIALATIIVQLGYPHFVQSKVADPYVVETIASDIVSYGVAVIIVAACIALISLKKIKTMQLQKVFILSIVFIALSSVPFMLIPGKGGYLSLLDGRHLYVTSIFSSILMAGVVYALFSLFEKKRIVLIALGIILVSYAGMHGLSIRSDLNKQMAYAYLRRLILNKVYSSYPKLPNQVIFYVESDTAYYGLADEEKILPFQSGFGQTLLVWYNAHGENIPSCFFHRQYLYVLLVQDYKECGGRGFGYYRDMKLLAESLQKNNLSSKNVIAFRYNSFSKSIIDITKEVQDTLQ